MRIVNVSHDPNGVLMVCDLEASSPGGLVYAAKLYPILAINAVMAVTGDFVASMCAYGVAVGCALKGRFDSTVEDFPASFRQAVELYKIEAPNTCIILAGWSESRRRMRVVEMQTDSDLKLREVENCTLIAPSFEEIGELYCDTIEELVDLARRQRPLTKQKMGDEFAAGDELVCLRLTRDRLEAWPAGNDLATLPGTDKAPGVTTGCRQQHDLARRGRAQRPS